MRRAIKQDKRKFNNNLANEAEIAANQHRIKDLYELTRILKGRNSSASKPIKDEHSNTLTKQQDELNRLGKFFEVLLNQPLPRGYTAMQEAEFMLDVNSEKTSKKKIAKAIHKQNK